MATKAKKVAAAGERIIVRQVASAAGRDKTTRAALDCLGLGRVGKERNLPLNRSVLGILSRVHNLVEIKESR